MDIPEKLREVLKKDGVVAIATLGQDGPHMVNTWNSYVRLTDDGRMLIPAGYMNQTEANVAFNPEVLMTLGSSKVPGNNGPGTGFLIEGTAAFFRLGSRLRYPQGDLRLDARRPGRHDPDGDADALAGCRSDRRQAAVPCAPASTGACGPTWPLSIVDVANDDPEEMPMAGQPMRSAKKEIDDREELHRILDEAMVMRLGMIDGERPYVVPLNFAREGDDLWFHAAKAGHKLDCLRAAPAVCVEVDNFIRLRTGPRACDDWSSAYESVIGFGRAEVVEDPAEKRRGLRTLMRKYSGREDWEFPDASVRGTAVVRIRLESLTGKRSPAAG